MRCKSGVNQVRLNRSEHEALQRELAVATYSVLRGALQRYYAQNLAQAADTSASSTAVVKEEEECCVVLDGLPECAAVL